MKWTIWFITLLVSAEGDVASADVAPQEDWCAAHMLAHRKCPKNSRCNLEPLWTMAREWMPDACTFVDVGANKGLVSARWLNLWRPSAGVTSADYANKFVKPYFDQHKVPARHCGVCSVCQNVDPTVADLVKRVPAPRCGESDNFTIHSFEPSKPLTAMHATLHAQLSTEAQRQWKWYPYAVSDVIAQVVFTSEWHEGGKINRGGKAPALRSHSATTATPPTPPQPPPPPISATPPPPPPPATPISATPAPPPPLPATPISATPPPPPPPATRTPSLEPPPARAAAPPSDVTNVTRALTVVPRSKPPRRPKIPAAPQSGKTDCTTLDALDARGVFGGRRIDVLKIDAEGVDLLVVRGAEALLRAGRVSFLMWETPNSEIQLFGERVTNLASLATRLDTVNMSCYIPGSPTIPLTGCAGATFDKLRARCAPLNEKIDHSNAACVHRVHARALYEAFERNVARDLEVPN